MQKLTEEQMKKGRDRYLASDFKARAVVDALTEREADILGIPLEDHRRIKTMELLRQHANSIGVSPDELFWSLCFDSAEEFNEFVRQRDEAIQRNLGLA